MVKQVCRVSKCQNEIKGRENLLCPKHQFDFFKKCLPKEYAAMEKEVREIGAKKAKRDADLCKKHKCAACEDCMVEE